MILFPADLMQCVEVWRGETQHIMLSRNIDKTAIPGRPTRQPCCRFPVQVLRIERVHHPLLPEDMEAEVQTVGDRHHAHQAAGEHDEESGVGVSVSGGCR